MKQLKFSFRTAVEFSVAVKEHQLALRCRPMEDAAQTLLACRVLLQPGTLPTPWVDTFGTAVYGCNVLDCHAALHYGSTGLAQVAYTGGGTPAPAPQPCLRYAGSRTAADDALRALYAAAPFVPGTQTPLAWAEELCHRVHGQLQYTPGVTGMHTTAAEALAGGQGVCQDYAHIYLVLARMAGLPARYIMGLTVGEGATHAWAEVYVDGAWYGFDPTRNCLTNEDYLRFGAGRDAADCPVEQGIFCGLADQTQTVWMRVEELEPGTAAEFGDENTNGFEDEVQNWDRSRAADRTAPHIV